MPPRRYAYCASELHTSIPPRRYAASPAPPRTLEFHTSMPPRRYTCYAPQAIKTSIPTRPHVCGATLELRASMSPHLQLPSYLDTFMLLHLQRVSRPPNLRTYTSA